MFRSDRWTSRLLLSLVGLLLMTALPSTPAHAHATPPTPSSLPESVAMPRHRPDTVPGTYTATPHGYVHPRCVIEIRHDQVVVPDGDQDVIVDLSPDARAALPDPDGRSAHPPSGQQRAVGLITAADKAKGRRVAACAHDRFDVEGRAQPRRLTRSSAVTTAPWPGGLWVERAGTTALGPISYLYGRWTVPPEPTTQSGQVIYLFPGLQSTSGTPTIMQPVLGWNHSRSGIPGWSIASWNCCSIGNSYHSEHIAVTPGAPISGDVTGTGCDAATGLCSTWSIRTYDGRTGRVTTLRTTSEGRTMGWLFGGVLEAYDIDTCAQLPGSSTRFSGLYVKDIHGRRRYPSWDIDTTSATPQCGYRVTAHHRAVTLYYRLATSPTSAMSPR